MGIRLLGFLVGQKPSERFVSNRIICHVGFGQQPSIVLQVLTMDENVDACPLNHARLLNIGAFPTQSSMGHRCGPGDDNMRAASTTVVVNIAHTDRFFWKNSGRHRPEQIAASQTRPPLDRPAIKQTARRLRRS